MKLSLACAVVMAFLALPVGALAASGNAVCVANARASLGAMVKGDFSAATGDFAPAIAKALPATKLKQTWAGIQTQAGKYHSSGASRWQQVHGRSLIVTPIAFANAPLDYVAGCDASQRINVFMFLEPEVVQARPPVDAQTLADGVRVEPLAVPSPLGPLRGALTLPSGKGPFPAVVLVQGSGPHDLDETVEGNKPFRDLAGGLAKRGIASLRYDKRTFDYGSKIAGKPDFTVDDEVTDDALTALHLLAKQREVDPHRVFVLGHSLGAMLAPRIAKRDPQLAGVIMLAAPARSFLAVIAAQIRELGPSQGASAEAIAKQEKAIAAEQQLLAHADPAHPPQGTFELLPGHAVQQAYLLSLSDYHQVATAQSLTLPMLILQGGNDFQVSPKLDFDAWKKALAGKPNVTFHLFPGLSHLFMPGPTKSPADYAKPAHVAPAVVDFIAKWISRAGTARRQ